MKISKIMTGVMSVALVVAGGVTHAEATASGGVDVNSAYIFRGATVNDEVNVTPYLEAALGDFTVGAWGNFNTDSEQFDEIDVYVSYGLELGDGISGSIGYTEYTYPTAVDAAGAGVEADREISVGVTMDELPLTPSLTANFGIEGPFLDDGIYITLSGSHDLEVGEFPVTAGATLGYEAGDNFKDTTDTGLSHLTLSLGTEISGVAISVAYVVETDDDVLETDEDVVVTAGLSF